MEWTKQTLDIATGAGATKTFICSSERGGLFRTIVLLTDARGIREELRNMAARSGHRRLLRATDNVAAMLTFVDRQGGVKSGPLAGHRIFAQKSAGRRQTCRNREGKQSRKVGGTEH